jgi:hypothetical protein
MLSWLKQLAIHTAAFGILVAPMFVHNYRVIGRLLPSSFYIKAMNYGITWALAVGNSEFLQHCLFVAPRQEALALLKLWGGNNIVLLAPFLPGLFWITWRAWEGREERCPSLMIPLALVVQPIAWAIATNFHRTEGPAFQSQRYVANLGPLYVIVGLAGAWWLVQPLTAGRRRVLWVAVVTLAAAASLVRHRDQVRLYTANVKNITELQVVTARWIRDNLPRDALLAVNDVGAIAVITECRIYDMIGLVSRESLACLSLEYARSGAWRDCRREAFATMEPDYFVANATPGSLHNYAKNPYLDTLIYDTEIDDNITAGGSMMVVFRTVWCEDPPVTGSDEPEAAPHADASP